MSPHRGASDSLDALLAPRSVAVIGASGDPTRIGGRPVSYLLRAGFAGDVWPVNPNRDTVQGLPAFASVEDVPGEPDVCIIAVAASIVPATLEACADRGARAAVILSAGFAEAGPEGAVAQRRISEIARERHIRVLGPNTLGLFNAHARWMGTFASTVLYGTPRPGAVGVASQSGAVGSELYALLRRRGVDTGVWITTGNEADVDLADAVSYLAREPHTELIVAYAEGVRNGDTMRAALARAAAAGKPVVFLKSGRSEVGAAAVESHTAAWAGVDRIYDGLFRQYGAVRVGNAEELVDAVYAAARAPLPSGRRLLVLTISGGAGVQMADAAADLGLDVPPPSAEAQEQLVGLVPFAATRNPVDTTAQVFNDIALIGRYLRILVEDADYDQIALFLTSVAASEEVAPALVRELEGVRDRFPDVPLVVSLAAPAELTRPYAEAGFPMFAEPTRAVRALSLLRRMAESKEREITLASVDVPRDAIRVPNRPLRGHAALVLLASWRVPGVEPALAGSEDGGVHVGVEVTHDATFGPVVMVGLGGELAGALGEPVFRLAPFDAAEARRMIAELSGASLFDGLRDRPAADVDALAELLERVSFLAATERETLARVDLDPVWVLPRGQGLVVQEALIEPASEA